MSDKIFVTSRKFRHFCPTLFCPMRYYQPLRHATDKIFVGRNYSSDKIFRHISQISSLLSDIVLSDKIIEIHIKRFLEFRPICIDGNEGKDT